MSVTVFSRSRPTVSVVVPCYRYGRFLEQCVDSILTQEGVDVRVLIIDDASPDDSFAVAERLAAQDSRVEARRHEVNRGHIATYNEGLLEWADGEYSVLISADDLLTPGALMRATDLMNRHPSVGFVYGHPVAFRDDSPLPPRTTSVGETVWKGGDWIELMCRAGANFIHCPEVVMRTSVQRRIGGYRRELPYSGDMEMWLRAAVVADVGRVNGCDQAYYRVHSQSMTRTSYVGFLADLKGRHEAFRSALNGSTGQIPDPNRLLKLADRAIADDALRRALEDLDVGDTARTAIAEYLKYARSLCPEMANTRKWRLIERRQAAGAGPKLIVWFRTRLRSIIRALAWRRWRRTGIE